MGNSRYCQECLSQSTSNIMVFSHDWTHLTEVMLSQGPSDHTEMMIDQNPGDHTEMVVEQNPGDHTEMMVDQNPGDHTKRRPLINNRAASINLIPLSTVRRCQTNVKLFKWWYKS